MFSNPFDANRSPWLTDKPSVDACKPASGELRVDLAIIGGGFTGMSTAYSASERWPQKNIAVIEARTIGNGASGRNGGQMLNWVHGVETDDAETAKRIYDTTSEAIGSIGSLIKKHRLDVGYLRRGHLDVFTNQRAAEEAKDSVSKLRSHGIPIQFLEIDELHTKIALKGTTGAILDPLAGQLDGVAYLRALKQILLDADVDIFENTPVTGWHHDAHEHRLETPDGLVRAKRVVLATNAYSVNLELPRKLRCLAKRVVPVHSTVIATEPRGAQYWASRGWKDCDSFTDDRDRLSYGTLTGSGRVIFGGGSNATYDYVFGNGTSRQAVAADAASACRDQLVSYLPELADTSIDTVWSGPVALTLSRICTMGCDETATIFYALGYSGHGVTLSNLAGRVLCDLMAGESEQWRPLPFFEQRLNYVPPEPLRWLGYQAYTRLTGRSPKKQ